MLLLKFVIHFFKCVDCLYGTGQRIGIYFIFINTFYKTVFFISILMAFLKQAVRYYLLWHIAILGIILIKMHVLLLKGHVVITFSQHWLTSNFLRFLYHMKDRIFLINILKFEDPIRCNRVNYLKQDILSFILFFKCVFFKVDRERQESELINTFYKAVFSISMAILSNLKNLNMYS